MSCRLRSDSCSLSISISIGISISIPISVFSLPLATAAKTTNAAGYNHNTNTIITTPGTLLRTSLSGSFTASHFRRIAPLIRLPSPLVFPPIPRYSASGRPRVPPSSIQSQACIAPSVALTGLPGALRLAKTGPWLPKSYMSHASLGFTLCRSFTSALRIPTSLSHCLAGSLARPHRTPMREASVAFYPVLPQQLTAPRLIPPATPPPASPPASSARHHRTRN